MTTTHITQPTDREIHVERIVNASRDRVWRAYTDPKQVAQWWGRGHALDIETMDVKRGGHWRYVEHEGTGTHGFEGRYREVTPQERIVRTFEWDGMPGHVIIEDVRFEDLGNGRTKIVTTMLFHTTEERDGMFNAGMSGGMDESYSALDRLLAGTT
ncbi:MAG: hypothetical protein JWM95_4567 [Gemmatimonadetes bacterium]|nr:hypothetical protein [Gemmatimonadota bacterium]